MWLSLFIWWLIGAVSAFIAYPVLRHLYNVRWGDRSWFKPYYLCPTYAHTVGLLAIGIAGPAITLMCTLFAIIDYLDILIIRGTFSGLFNKEFWNRRICDK